MRGDIAACACLVVAACLFALVGLAFIGAR